MYIYFITEYWNPERHSNQVIYQAFFKSSRHQKDFLITHDVNIFLWVLKVISIWIACQETLTIHWCLFYIALLTIIAFAETQ